MTINEASALVLQLLIPLGLVARVGFVRKRTRLSWGLDLVLAVSYLAAIALAIPWLALPWYLPWVFAALLLVAAVAGGRRAGRDTPAPRGLFARAGLGLRGLLTLILVGVTAVALWGRRGFAEPAVGVASPLGHGTYLVANGGSSELINPHLKTLTAERFRSYRGQSYALDVVRVGAWGSRSSGMSPDDPTGYAIFGDTLRAPCAGRVVRAVDGAPDRLPEGREPETLEGNVVIVECEGAWVVLAHLQQGSVAVRQGDRVSVGETVGLVGNSGNSDEPHLHIHAQTPGTTSDPLGGEPLPITIDGRHLVRNDRFRESGR